MPDNKSETGLTQTDGTEGLAWLELEDKGVPRSGLEVRLLFSDTETGVTCKSHRRDHGSTSTAEWGRSGISTSADVEQLAEAALDRIEGDGRDAHDIRFAAASSGDITRH